MEGFFAGVIGFGEKKWKLLSYYNGENSARQAKRSDFQLVGWTVHHASAIFLIPVALEASGPSQCCGCFSAESWYCYADLVLYLFLNEWNQPYFLSPGTIVLEMTILPFPQMCQPCCHIHSGYTRLSLSSWYCQYKSVLCYSLFLSIPRQQAKSRTSFSITQKNPRGSCTQQHCNFVLSRLLPSPVLQPRVDAAFAIMGSDFLRSGNAL